MVAVLLTSSPSLTFLWGSLAGGCGLVSSRLSLTDTRSGFVSSRWAGEPKGDGSESMMVPNTLSRLRLLRSSGLRGPFTLLDSLVLVLAIIG